MGIDDDEGCPTCGSMHCRRLHGPDERSSDVENLDVARSGEYECLRCGDEYYAEFELRAPDPHALPKFSPHAKCPGCNRYNTRIQSVSKERSERRHQCNDCYRVFYTSIADVE